VVEISLPSADLVDMAQQIGSATMMASSGASRTAGRSDNSPIASDTSTVSAP
jgi:hypothetical protein